mgnify:CR=1 FL=1
MPRPPASSGRDQEYSRLNVPLRALGDLLMIRAVIVGYAFANRSKRRICAKAQANLLRAASLALRTHRNEARTSSMACFGTWRWG